MNKRIVVKGAVQGIGYRPFISEKATEYGLTGYVKNCGAAVEIFVSGKDQDIEDFIKLLKREVPAGGFILSVDSEFIEDTPLYQNFSIIESSKLDLSGELPVFLPDIGICDDCMKEMLDVKNRRYRYPLISCAVCGPRMSILNRLPYDRNTTTMEHFKMCPSCLNEYTMGRRKYAQTISCHNCGPQMHFRTIKEVSEGDAPYTTGEDAVKKAVSLLANGEIIGLKGISGYQLIALPKKDVAKRLRIVKGRENKPFALMFSTVDDIRKVAYISEKEKELLTSSQRPIVLLNIKKTDNTGCNDLINSDNCAGNIDNDLFSDEVIKGSRYIGAFLPSAGIHRLLTDALGPLIVTSANRSDEPMIIDDSEFISVFMDNSFESDKKVSGVLFHERKINMPQDDSVMFVVSVNGVETEQFIRRARGFAPLPILLEHFPKNSKSVFALGGDLKNTFALGRNDKIIPSQYIGDLKDYKVKNTYRTLYEGYLGIFEFKPEVVVKDLHPAYVSSQFSKKLFYDGISTIVGLQHHMAHTYSVMAENSLDTAIGVSFDGTGFGLDERIWGGEFLDISKTNAKRMGHLSYVKLAGGNDAPKDAYKVALCYFYLCRQKSLLDIESKKYIIESNKSLPIEENEKTYKYLEAALKNNINTFETSSMGRLFDAVSALLGVRYYNTYEGEAAIMLESRAQEFLEKFCMGSSAKDTSLSSENTLNIPKADTDYPVFSFDIAATKDGFCPDQLKMFSDIYKCFASQKYCTGAISFGFHMSLCDLVVRCCDIIRKETGENKVCLSGGVFNNRLLLTGAAQALLKEKFEVYWNRKVPLGDGGISTGQAYYGLLCEENN